MPKTTRINLLGVEVDALTIQQAIDHIIDHAADHTRPASYVVKPYVEFMDQAATNPALQQIFNDAELTLPDGVALLWAATFLYDGPRTAWRFIATLAQIVLQPTAITHPLPERIAGINFTWPLLETAASRQISVFFIGKATQRDIEATAQIVQQQLPALHIAGTRPGYDPTRPAGEVSEAWIQNTLTAVQEVHPDLVLVGMGFPLQEHVMARLAPHLDHGVLIGEGGTFDYQQFGGQRRKAPAAFQRLGLEWLWRLILEPQRIRRQLAIPRFIWRVWQSRKTYSQTPAE